MKIILCETRYSLKDNTKTVYQIDSVIDKTISEQQLKNITDKQTLKFFRRLGGSETLTCGYTCRGYMPVILVSTSPDKKTRIIREFEYL